LHIVLISPFSKPDLGGVESHLDKLIDYLKEKEDVYITLITYKPLNSAQRVNFCSRDDKLEIYRMPWFGRGWFSKLEKLFPLNFLYLFPGLFMCAVGVLLASRRSIDVIHAHGFIAGAITKIVNFFLRRRSVISTHAVYGLEPRTIKTALFKWVLLGFDRILAVGEPSRQEIVKIGCCSEKVEVHPNWVDLDRFKPLERSYCLSALGLDRSANVVLFVGRMIGIKGELLLLEAAQKSDCDIIFVFAGAGPMAEKIKAESAVNRNVVFLGKVDDELMPALFNLADVFVSPVSYEEGYATVYLESLACGTPVITSPRGCLPYFLDDSVASFIDTSDSLSLLNIIKEVTLNNLDRQSLRARCREFAKRNFSSDNAEVIYNSYKGSYD